MKIHSQKLQCDENQNNSSKRDNLGENIYRK